MAADSGVCDSESDSLWRGTISSSSQTFHGKDTVDVCGAQLAAEGGG